MAADEAPHGDGHLPPAAHPLTVDAKTHGAELHVRLSGDLDLTSAATFQRELGRLEAGDPAMMRLDLSELQFIDSTGLRLITELYRRCVAARRVLWLTPARPSVQRMFEVTLLDQTLPFGERTTGLAPSGQSLPD